MGASIDLVAFDSQQTCSKKRDTTYKKTRRLCTKNLFTIVGMKKAVSPDTAFLLLRVRKQVLHITILMHLDTTS